MTKQKRDMSVIFHGTTKENAINILRNGFLPHTYFAAHLEDALEFGSTWVFMVLSPKIDVTGWQFCNYDHISPKKILRLTQYRPIVRYGKQAADTRKEKVIYKSL